jgi:hypothetical protein
MHITRTSDLLLSLFNDEGGSGGGSGGSGGSGTGGQQNGSTGGQQNGGQTGGSGDGARAGDRGGAGGGTGTGSGSGGQSGGGQQNTDRRRKLEDLDRDELIEIARGYRGEAAEHRTGKREVEQTLTDLQRKVAAAFGIDVDGDGKPDPDKLAADLAKAQDTARMRSVELAVYRTAPESGADPAALLDSRTFLDSVSDLDPTAQDFTTRLGDKVTEAVKNNPRLSAGGGTNGSGGRPGGGIGQGGRGQQSGPVGVAAGRALHQERKGTRQNATSTT